MIRSLSPVFDQTDEFELLQAQLRSRWHNVDQFNDSNHDILVIPSLSLDQRELQKIQGIHYYEERLLFSLIRLRNPRTRLIYVTSQPIHPNTIEYFLHLLPGIPFSHVRDRLLLFCTYDSSLKPLTQKILERPRLVARLRDAIRQDRTYMTCFNSTPLERELSVQLGVPLLALNPALLEWGTKCGSRKIFAEANIPHPDGSDLVRNAHDLAAAAVDLWERQPDLQRMVVKLNEGFSGEGNAILDLRSLSLASPQLVSPQLVSPQLVSPQLPLPQVCQEDTRTKRVQQIYDRFPWLSFQCATETWENFGQRIPELGAIVEAFIEGAEKRSPSVQGMIHPTGQVEILSTHDQILGGPDQQIFLGCRFPADAAYRLQLQEYGLQVGKVLAEKGALERYGVDFVAVYQAGQWQLQAIEINLRKGGTTHPFMLLKLLTDGHYDNETGLFYTRQGKAKYYVATDTLQNDAYGGLLPSDLMDVIAEHQLHFNSTTETGTVFHLIGCLSEFGKVGLTSIADSPAEAEAMYNQVIQALDGETRSDICYIRPSDRDWQRSE